MTSVMPIISAVMPVYNGRPFVTAAITSIVNQTLQPIELIVIDDGSTDGSDKAVELVQAPFPIKLIRQPNRGQSAARNAGVNQASGEFIAFLDQDDEWRARHLELLSAQITAAPDIGWAYGDFDEIDALGRTVTRGFLHELGGGHPKHTLGACLGGDTMVLPSSSLIRATAFAEIGGFDEALCGYEDDDLFLRMFRTDWRQVYLPTSITRFRVHGSSSSAGRRFLRSRMIYVSKLRASIVDDQRLNRHWLRDLVAPRFFQTTVEDYVRAINEENWDLAYEAADAARVLAEMMPPTLRRRLELALLDRPQTCRRVLLALSVLPEAMRPPINPALRLARSRH